MTSGRSQRNLFEGEPDMLTSSPGDSLVKTSARSTPEAKVLTASGRDSGAKCFEWFARYDPASSSWKTPRAYLTGDLEKFSETWPRSGSMLNGRCCRRVPSALHTHGKGCSLWLTPTANDSKPAGAARNGNDAPVFDRAERIRHVQAIALATGGGHGFAFAREPGVPRVADGIPHRTHRNRALGNAVVPQVVYPIFEAIAQLEAAHHL
jgi:hypothetical protein